MQYRIWFMFRKSALAVTLNRLALFVVLSLGWSIAAYAVTYVVQTVPRPTAVVSGRTEVTGDIIMTTVLGSALTVNGSVDLDYGVPIAGWGSVSCVSNDSLSVPTVGGIAIQNSTHFVFNITPWPLGSPSRAYTITVRGIRVDIASNPLPMVIVRISITGNSIVSGQNNVVVVMSTAAGIRSLTGTAAVRINSATGAIGGSNQVTLTATEGFPSAFGRTRASDPWQANTQQIKIQLDQRLPPGLKVYFPSYDSSQNWQRTTGSAYLDFNSGDNPAVYYSLVKDTDLNSVENFILSNITVTADSAVYLPTIVSSTVSLGPIDTEYPGARPRYQFAPVGSVPIIDLFSSTYQLTTTVSPASAGIINANPTSTNGLYNGGTSVLLNATARSGYVFSSWSGDLTSTLNPLTVTMSAPLSVTGNFVRAGKACPLTLNPGGAEKCRTAGENGVLRVGYAKLALNSGTTPYGTAVVTFKQSGVTVSETGVPASSPTTRARIFVDYRNDVDAVPGRSGAGKIDINTGIVVINDSSAVANVEYTLRNMAGATLATGHGQAMAAGTHISCFLHELRDRVAPDFVLPPDFQNTIGFGSLEISSDKPVVVLALRGIFNQIDQFLITTTPIADLSNPLNFSPLYFPHFVDGGGYTTSLILLNTSSEIERGTLQILDNHGAPLVVNQVGGTADSSFPYSIPPNGVFRFQTDGFPTEVKAGWARLTSLFDSAMPIGSGVFGFNPQNILVSESGIPAADSTTHARVYVDLSKGHNTGLAIANLANTSAIVTVKAIQSDGITQIGTSQGPVPLDANGHAAAFANELISGLPDDFTGVLDIGSSSPFAALTLRSFTNEQNDFLMTTFPIADMTKAAPSPVAFPQVVNGGGYVTEFILISTGEPAVTTIGFYDENGVPMDLLTPIVF